MMLKYFQTADLAFSCFPSPPSPNTQWCFLFTDNDDALYFSMMILLILPISFHISFTMLLINPNMYYVHFIILSLQIWLKFFFDKQRKGDSNSLLISNSCHWGNTFFWETYKQGDQFLALEVKWHSIFKSNTSALFLETSWQGDHQFLAFKGDLLFETQHKNITELKFWLWNLSNKIVDIFVRCSMENPDSFCSIRLCRQEHLSPARLVQSFYSLLLDEPAVSLYTLQKEQNGIYDEQKWPEKLRRYALKKEREEREERKNKAK